jgi:ankyrin repeat protein
MNVRHTLAVAASIASVLCVTDAGAQMMPSSSPKVQAAIRANDISEVLALLRAETRRNGREIAALRTAAELDRSSVMWAVLEFARARLGKSPLELATGLAIGYRANGCLERLLREDVRLQDVAADGALRAAITVGDEVSARMVLKAGALPNVLGQDGETAMHHAAALSADWVELLLKHGGNPNIEDQRGCTPIFFAAPTSLRALFAAGAVPTRTDKRRRSPLWSLGSRRSWRRETLDELLRAGVRIEHKDGLGQTVLHHAAHEGDLSLVRMLLEKGADPAAKDLDQRMPQDLARGAQEKEIREPLRQSLRQRV